jgi:Secretion system C-terminal sorting domain
MMNRKNISQWNWKTGSLVARSPCLAVFLAVCWNLSLTSRPCLAQVQAVNGRFVSLIQEGSGTGGTDRLQVTIELQAEGTSFDIGNASLMFTYDETVLSLPSNPAINERLSADADYSFIDPFIQDPGQLKFYTNTITVFGAVNRLSVNIVLDLIDLGQRIGTDYTPVIKFFFDINSPVSDEIFSWVVEPDPNPTVVFQDDNLTIVPSGVFVDGANTNTSIESNETVLPDSPQLLPIYPNPFQNKATIRYALPRSMKVEIIVYDQIGRIVATLMDGREGAGFHENQWAVSELASGVYIIRLRTSSATRVQRAVIVN